MPPLRSESDSTERSPWRWSRGAERKGSLEELETPNTLRGSRSCWAGFSAGAFASGMPRSSRARRETFLARIAALKSMTWSIRSQFDEPAELQRKIGTAQARVGRERDAKGSGNRTKRIRLHLRFEGPGQPAVSLEEELCRPPRREEVLGLLREPERFTESKTRSGTGWRTLG